MDTEKVEKFESGLLEVYGGLVSAKISRSVAKHESQELYNRLIAGVSILNDTPPYDDVMPTTFLSFETVTIMYDLGVRLAGSDPLSEARYIERGYNAIKFLGKQLEDKNPYTHEGRFFVGCSEVAEVSSFLSGKTRADWERNDVANVPIKQQKQNTERFAMALV